MCASSDMFPDSASRDQVNHRLPNPTARNILACVFFGLWSSPLSDRLIVEEVEVAVTEQAKGLDKSTMLSQNLLFELTGVKEGKTTASTSRMVYPKL